MKLFGKDGIEMMDVKSIQRDGERLVLKGKMMGTMATTIYVGPEEMWDALKLFPIGVILRMPLLLLKGWSRRRKNPAPAGRK
jgi:hypothetical protein